ncbi:MULTISPECIES: ABC transporter permease [unclassified Kitasatospora]|uniref:ABC transporter permease n=1 Tax=unclassified Kitasatospora TaxID=2633591 RepID=UPI00340289C4
MTTQAGTPVPTPDTAHQNAHQPARRPAHRPARWVRTRLRANPMAALLMAALAFVTVFLAAAFPRVTDRGADTALQDFVSQKGLNQTSLQTTSKTQDDDNGAELDRVQRQLTEMVGRQLTLAQPGQAHGARALADRGMGNPEYVRIAEKRTDPVLGLLYVPDLAARATLTDGTWPTPGTVGGPLPIVISKQAAETIHIKLGDVIDNGVEGSGTKRTTVVVGLYQVNDPQDPFWDDLGCPARACLRTDPRQEHWMTNGFVDGGSLPALTRWGSNAENFWRLPVDPASLHADRLDHTRSVISSFLTGRDATALADATRRADLHTASGLPDVLTRADERYRASLPLSAIGPAGVAGVATVVLFLAAALTTDRRTAEIRLLQARGGSRTGVLGRLIAEGAVTVLPAAALGTALALVLLPTVRWDRSVLAALVATLTALLAFPTRAALLWSRRRPYGGRRRLVGELTVLAVTVAAVAEVRRRGVGHPGAGVDPLLVAAPLLLAVTGGLLLARIEPVLVGRLAALVGRGRGLIGFLGLARAARDASGRRRPSVLPLLALLIAVTTTGFGATVLDTVDHVRARAARIATGGDVSVVIPDYATLTESFTKAAAALPGVRASTGAWVEPRARFFGADQDYTEAYLVVVEPTAYAEIARTLGAGEFDPAKLAGTPGTPGTSGRRETPVPALFSRDLAKRLAAGPAEVRTPNGNSLRTTVAGIVDATPALPDPGKPFVVVPAGPTWERLPDTKRVNKWFAVGDVDPDRVRTALRDNSGDRPVGMAKLIADSATATGKDTHGLPAGYTVHSSRETAAALGDDPLQHAAGRLFWYAAAAGAGFALLAVLLTLLRAAPDRTAVLARLRTMGLRPRQGLALIIAEALPQTLAAAVGGGLVAAAAVGLLGPAFDISTLVGAKVGEAVTPTLLPVLLPTVGLALLVCLGVVAETLVAGRRQIATELRAGEQS